MSSDVGRAGTSEQDGGRAIRALCWSERTEPARVYPDGINGAVAAALQAAGAFETRVANLDTPLK